MVDFADEDLTGVRLAGSVFRGVDLTGVRVVAARLDGVRMSGVELTDVEIDVGIGRLSTVPALRAERMLGVREVVDGLTGDSLASAAVFAPPWGGEHAFTVAECLRVVLDEEYQHRRYAERDLDALLESSG